MAKVASYSTNTGSPTLTINKPSGTASGDLLLLLVSTAQTDASQKEITTPSGFTLIQNIRTQSGNATINTSLFYKVAGGSEPSSYSVSADPSYISALMLRVTGWDQSYTFGDFASDGYSSGSSSSTANAVSLSSLTLTRPGDLILVFASQNASLSFSAAASGYSFSSEASVGSNPSQAALSTQSTQVTTFPASSVTPGSAAGYQATVAIVFAIPTDRVTASALSGTATIGAASFARLVAVSSLSAVVTLGSVIVSNTGRAWSALAKSASSWSNQNKS